MTTAAANQPPDLSRFDLQPVKKKAGPDLSRFDLQPVEREPAGPDLSRFDLQPAKAPTGRAMRAYMPPKEMMTQAVPDVYDRLLAGPGAAPVPVSEQYEAAGMEVPGKIDRYVTSLGDAARFLARPALWAGKAIAPQSEALDLLLNQDAMIPESDDPAEALARLSGQAAVMVGGFGTSPQGVLARLGGRGGAALGSVAGKAGQIGGGLAGAFGAMGGAEVLGQAVSGQIDWGTAAKEAGLSAAVIPGAVQTLQDLAAGATTEGDLTTKIDALADPAVSALFLTLVGKGVFKQVRGQAPRQPGLKGARQRAMRARTAAIAQLMREKEGERRAQEVRGYPGPVPPGGAVPERGEASGGQDIQRPAEARPEARVREVPKGAPKAPEAMTPFGEKVPSKPTIKESTTWWSRAKKHLSQYVEAPESPQVRAAEQPASTALIDKLAKEIIAAKPARRKTEALRHKERQRRAGKIAGILERGKGEEVLKRAMGPLAGEYPLVGFEPIGPRFSAAERDALHDHIRTHSLLEGKSITKAAFGDTLRAVLDHGKLPTQGELSLFYDLFGPKVTRALMSKFGAGTRAWRRFNDIANMIRANVASYDLSATLRQGWHLITHPRRGPRAFADQVRAFKDEAYAREVDRKIKSGPQVALREKTGLFLSDISGKPLPELKEEFYGTDTWHRMAQAKVKGKGLIPSTLRTLQYTGIGGLGSPKMIRASERAFSTTLNRLRADTFDAIAEEYRRIGLDPKNDKDFHHFKTLADFINSSTGRGDPLIKKDWANTLFFSQRFLTSRFQHPYRLVKALKGPAPLRREAIRQLVTSAGIWLGVAAMIKLAAEKYDFDADVELDPRSSDFLKIRIGNARIDMGAGYGQVVRLIAHLMTSEYKELRTGKIKRADAQKKLSQYFRYKLAPVPSAAWSVVQRKTPDWKEPTPQKIAWELIAPINVQTLFEVIDEQGARGAWLLIPETLGLGASVYEREKRP
jgi:hypothetical protein